MDTMEPQPSAGSRQDRVEPSEDGWKPGEIGVVSRALFTGNFLPVLVLGPTGAGKTMMIASVINYFRANPHSLRVNAKVVDLNLTANGQPFAAGIKMMEDAHRLFREISHQLDRAVVPQTPVASAPFFLPIELEDQNDPTAPAIRIALMDGSGEHLNAVDVGNSTTTPYGHLRLLVQGVLKDFSSGLACVFVLPHPPINTTVDLDANPVPNQLPRLRHEDVAMENAIKQYQVVRPVGYQKYDWHLLMLSQWDRQVPWQSVKFLAIDKIAMLKTFDAAYRNTKGAFFNLAGSRAWMPYSAALVAEGGNTILTPLSADRLGIFSNRFVAWICAAYFSSFNLQLRRETRRLNGSNSGKTPLLRGVIKYFPSSLFGGAANGTKLRGDDPAIDARRESEAKRLAHAVAAAKAAADETARAIERLKADMSRIDAKLDEVRQRASGASVSALPVPVVTQKSWAAMRLLMLVNLLKRIWDELFELSLAA